MILDARELCVLSMWEQIRCIIMNRVHDKLREAMEQWVGTLCPKIRQKVRKNEDFSANCFATPTPVQGMGVFEVLSNQNTYIVELNMRSCSCRRWQLTGIPCSHVLACLRHERIKADLMVASCYKLSTYVEAYKGSIYPVGDKTEWIRTNGPDILPPYYEKKVGRPKRSRRKNPEELADGTRLSKHGVKMHCGYCRDPNHTRRNCLKYKADVLRELEPEQQQPEQPQEQAEQQPEQQQPEQEAPAEQQPEQQTDHQPEHEPEQQAPAQPQKAKRKRKPSLKAREQEEAEEVYARMRKKAKTFDENGDIDDPSILEVR